MKFKYKKIVLLITFGTMFIGMIVFSMIPSSKNNTKDTSSGQAVSGGGIGYKGNDVLKKNAYPKINELVTNYFNAKMTVNMELMGKLVSDITQVDERKLTASLQYVEGMENIECYSIDGQNEGNYRVYVYYDLKIRGVVTPAPALTGLYITQGSDGNYIIYLSSLDEASQDFISQSDESKEVKKLTELVRVKLDKAIKDDQQLRDFYQMLEDGTTEPNAAVSGSAISGTSEPTTE